MESMASLLRLQVGRLSVQDSLTPFLYHTKTLLRQFSSDAERAIPSPRKRSEARRSTRTLRDVGDRELQEFRKGRLGSNPSRRRLPNSTDDGDRMHTIPFEGDSISKLEGTTMTPKEFFKFETLMRKRVNASDRTSNPKKASHNILETKSVKPDFPKPLLALAKEAEEMRNKSCQTTTAALDVSSEYFLQVKDRMDHASSDVALWNILQTDVLSRITTLQEQLSMKQMRRLQEANELRELTRSVPQLLVHFIRLTRTTFRGSSLGPVLLPSLKNLGASAFALMATTELYNEHMHLLYRQYSDLDAIAQTLSEMDQEVYEFDKGTQELLGSILKHAHASIRGCNGQGQKALWLTDRKTRSLAKMERWNQIVDMRVQSAAMRKARESPADVVGT